MQPRSSTVARLRDAAGRVVSAATAPLAVTMLIATAGCTMCPDPFDYSGPVPNGSVTQNNFQARSNGIIPLGMTPRPWPRIVRVDAASPPLAEVEGGPDAAADETDAAGDGLQPASVLVEGPPSESAADPAVIR